MTRALLISAGCIAVLTFGAAPAQAAPDALARTQAVFLADLNLASPAGAKAALQRLRSAAQHVCENGGAARVRLNEFRDQVNCQRRAMDAAVMRLHSPQVAAAYLDLAAQPADTKLAVR